MSDAIDSVASQKKWLVDALSNLAMEGTADLARRIAAAYHPNSEWRGPHPLNEMQGVEHIEAKVWGPLLHSFPDLERRDLIVAGGEYQGADYVATMGHYCGVFRKDWLGIPATGRAIMLRFGEVHRIEAGRISQSSVLFDVLDLMRQAGFWPIAPSLGMEMQWPAPLGTGKTFDEIDPKIGTDSIAATLRMHGGIHGYKHNAVDPRSSYLASNQQHFWHEKMMWYGPAGIGTARGWQNYVDYHAVPWITAFPDRHSVGHYIRIGDGAVSVTGGWPSQEATHLGGGLFGLGPTGRIVRTRIMDFYLHDGDKIRENWVPMDVIDLLRQLGVDVFARLESLFQRG